VDQVDREREPASERGGAGVARLQWTLAHNLGVAFSLFNDGHVWQRWGLAGFALLVSQFLLRWLLKLGAHERPLGARARAGDRRRAGQRDRPRAARLRRGFRRALRGLVLLARVQRRRLLDLRRRRPAADRELARGPG
jgi:hypothetical protein